MLILLPRAAVVVVLLLLVLPLLLLLVMPATVAAAGCEAPELENDRLPVLLVLRRTALAPVDVAKAANCLVGRSTEVSMAAGLPLCLLQNDGGGVRRQEVDDLSGTRTSRAGWAWKRACVALCMCVLRAWLVWVNAGICIVNWKQRGTARHRMPLLELPSSTRRPY